MLARRSLEVVNDLSPRMLCMTLLGLSSACGQMEDCLVSIEIHEILRGWKQNWMEFVKVEPSKSWFVALKHSSDANCFNNSGIAA